MNSPAKIEQSVMNLSLWENEEKKYILYSKRYFENDLIKKSAL